jgi:uncharacterized protein YndB with AHSA1/START domain
MPVTSVEKDVENLTITVVADFPVPVQRLWDAYLDPRQIERFWGPPTYPATFTRHDATPGGTTSYFMTSPEGERHGGAWEWLAVDAPHSFRVKEGFAGADGLLSPEMPVTVMTFDFAETATGSRLTTTSQIASTEDWDQLVGMGMVEGMAEAFGQIDAVVADLAAFAASLPTASQILSDTQVRVARVIRGTVEQVWRAHQEPELMQRWLLGPDGWVMPVCEVARNVGDTYRYEWEKVDGGDRFGFTGELLESVPPVRSVTTESMIGTDFASVRNEMTLTPVDGGTLLSIVMTYPSAEVRDMVLATGMTDGMETSYARLEGLLAEPALV